MSTLAKRIEDLERSSATGLGFRMIVRRIVDVGRLDGEAVRCVFEGREWLRCDDESEEQFEQRVYEAIIAVPQRRIPCVLMY